MQEPVPGISAVPDDGNARYFHVVVAGPEGSPFEGGVFKLELFLPEDYPMSAPKVHHRCIKNKKLIIPSQRKSLN